MWCGTVAGEPRRPHPNPGGEGVAPVRFQVRGRVQGVGFRWFVLREAQRLRVVGFVSNLPDGSVEVVARGSAEAIDALGLALARGPALARVDSVEKYELPHDIDAHNSFEIR
jgi:acylphosphatase